MKGLDIAKLKTALAEVSQQEQQQDGSKSAATTNTDVVNDEVRRVAKREAVKSEDDIYQEVFIDEIN